jgi:repressor LexA
LFYIVKRTFFNFKDMDEKTKAKAVKIERFYRSRKRMPTLTEIMALFGYRSKNTAHYLVEKLVNGGLIEKDTKGFLIPGNLLGNTRILGTVEAGFPSPAEEGLSDTITLDEYLIKNKEATFILKVSGDSMMDAGIMPGDMALVERGRIPKNGDIVIAEVDDAWTMKYFKKHPNGKVELIAANKKYPRIIPRAELRIAAVVTAVIRKY